MKKLIAAALLAWSSGAIGQTVTYSFDMTFYATPPADPIFTPVPGAYDGMTGHAEIKIDMADLQYAFDFSTTSREYNFHKATLNFDIGAVSIDREEYWHAFVNSPIATPMNPPISGISQYGYLDGKYYQLGFFSPASPIVSTQNLVGSSVYIGEHFQSGTVSFAGSNGTIANMTVTVTPVPEPGEWAMMTCGLAIVGVVVRRHRKAQKIRGAQVLRC